MSGHRRGQGSTWPRRSVPPGHRSIPGSGWLVLMGGRELRSPCPSPQPRLKGRRPQGAEEGAGRRGVRQRKAGPGGGSARGPRRCVPGGDNGNTGGGERLTASGKFPAGLPFPGLLSPRAFHLSSQALSLQPVNQLLPPRMGLPYPSNKPQRVAYGKWQLEWRRFAHFQISKQRAS